MVNCALIGNFFFFFFFFLHWSENCPDKQNHKNNVVTVNSLCQGRNQSGERGLQKTADAEAPIM